MKSINIVIPHYGSSPLLEKCLSSLDIAFCNYPLSNLSVIVVLNYSDSTFFDPYALLPTKEYSLPLEFLYESSVGSYACRNRGVMVSSADYIYFLDSDIFVPLTWFKSLSYVVSNPDISDIVAGDIQLHPPPKLTLAYAYERIFEFNQKRSVSRGSAPTANLLCKRSLFSKSNLFNQDLFSGSDKEWVSKAVRAGATLTFNHSLLVFHPSRSQIRDIIYKYRRTYGGWFYRYGCGSSKYLNNILYFIWSLRFPLRAYFIIFSSPEPFIIKIFAIITLNILRFARVCEHLRLSFGLNMLR